MIRCGAVLEREGLPEPTTPGAILHTFCTQVNRIDMAQKNKESREPDSFEKEMLIELQNALNQQFSATFRRVQKDYGSVGVKMAKAADAILYDQDFVDFLFGFYDGARVLLDMPVGAEDNLQAYPRVLSQALFIFKWQHHLPVNVPGHVESVLAGDRYLRRFLREFFIDTYKSNREAMNHPTL